MILESGVVWPLSLNVSNFMRTLLERASCAFFTNSTTAILSSLIKSLPTRFFSRMFVLKLTVVCIAFTSSATQFSQDLTNCFREQRRHSITHLGIPRTRSAALLAARSVVPCELEPIWKGLKPRIFPNSQDSRFGIVDH